jgi:FixJ family two-component response regulator
VECQRCVYIVDDDRDVRTSISFMLGAAGLTSRPFAGGTDFIEALGELRPGVILLDLRMPDMDGFRVMSELAARSVQWPVLAMTGHGEIAVAVRAMKLGAADFIEKPFAEELLVGCLERAFADLDERIAKVEEQQSALDKLAQLTRREHEVLRGLLAGLPNKSLARRLGISLRTVEMHRANMMERLGVASLAEALTLAVRAGVEPLERDVA